MNVSQPFDLFGVGLPDDFPLCRPVNAELLSATHRESDGVSHVREPELRRRVERVGGFGPAHQEFNVRFAFRLEFDEPVARMEPSGLLDAAPSLANTDADLLIHGSRL